ncbi:hypothetical protein BY458DRAFT_427791, partial [Sporodiniella umbellata]
GLFAGYGATFIRDAPFAGIYLFFYEGIKTWAKDYTTSRQTPVANVLINLGSGVAAGMAATCITQPFDMLKTRMQLKPAIYKNLLQSFKKVYMKSGNFYSFFLLFSLAFIFEMKKTLIVLASSLEASQLEIDINKLYEPKYLKLRGVPKGLLPISGKPVLSWLYKEFKEDFSQTWLVTNAYNNGILSDLAFIHRVKKLQEDAVILFPHLIWDEAQTKRVLFENGNFILKAGQVPIAFGLTLEAIQSLDELKIKDSHQSLESFVEKQHTWISLSAIGNLMGYAYPQLSISSYLNQWEDCLSHKQTKHTNKTEPIHQRAYARVGLMGNPSDGFFGKTMSLLISNFWAEATLIPGQEGEAITILPNSVSDPHYFNSMNCLASVSEIDGYETGDKLLQACCKVFYRYCQAQNIPIQTQQGFKMMFDTNIPRQVGLAGSSAIITALWKALCVFYSVKNIPLEVQASLILKVEQEELGIAAGLQDRVIQSFGGLVYMDFNQEQMNSKGYGLYQRLDVSLLPPLWLAYIADPEDSGKVHSTVKQRFFKGDKEIVDAMKGFASFTDKARDALESKDHAAFAQLMSFNFDLRKKIYGDQVVGKRNLRMIELAQQHQCVAKFPGSGGAVVGVWNGLHKSTEQSDLFNLRHALESEGFVFLVLSPKVYTDE